MSSFVGSVVAHGVLVLAGNGGGGSSGGDAQQSGGYGVPALVISQVLKGLVRHTMTVTTSLMVAQAAGYDDDHGSSSSSRTVHMGRLSASATVAWIVGPSAGAYLFSHVGTYAPIYVACALFLLNTVVAMVCLPNDGKTKDSSIVKKQISQQRSQKRTTKEQSPSSSSSSPLSSSSKTAMKRILSNFQGCFQSENSCLTATVLALLLFQFISRATSYRSISTYYEQRYGIESHERGYLQSYQSALTFAVQSSLVKPLLQALGGEVRAACAASLLMSTVTFAELYATFWQYLVVLCPLSGIASALLGVCLKSLVSKAAPKSSLSSVYATIDVLQNVAMVTVPFYRTFLFRLSAPQSLPQETMIGEDSLVDALMTKGDPDPRQWAIISGWHWVLATAAFVYLLIQDSPCEEALECPVKPGEMSKDSNKVKTT